ncbi:uncharacterized protein RHOBADRAFT_52217 [Rhodotorula graminis WP1]|uniref:Uncharacterized protein n=1 Tax=Rhodotorula graminis (strain WP1) TaxID=578459 RepID=A0A194S618_RHOGW|nr:uncharacterized protein RHOBADRAFT_52217 [Rhodotorula graminis WP1]KPV76173.1 hypothetical protein RHOBADRAFT_52217 [Rhodotorula graminis WP1]
MLTRARTATHARLEWPISTQNWSQPSTSKVPYSPSRPFSSTAPHPQPSARPTTSAPAQLGPEPPFARLEAALDAPSPQHRRDTLRAVSKSLEALAASPSTHALSRPTFDALFSRVTDLLPTEPTFAAATLKRLRDVALAREPRPEWQLSLAQAHAVLTARVEQEENETALWWKRGVRPTGAPERGSEGGKMRRRWRYVDECADEYWAAVEARGVLLADAERDDAAALVERYARAVAERMSSSLSAPADLPLAALSARSFVRAFSLVPPPSHDVEPQPDHAASKPLVPLFAHDRPAFLSHLRTLLAHGRLPSASALRQIVTAHYAERDAHLVAQTSALARLDDAAADEAAYAHARRVLDEACTGSSARRGANAGLDALLEQRLERVERAEALDREPVLFFLRWLGVGLSAEEERHGRRVAVDERRDMLSAAMRLWEASQVQGRSEWDAPARRYVRSRRARLLEALVLEAARLEGQGAASSSTTGKARASECLVEAVRMASTYLHHHILVHHATPLLLALTASSHSPPVALDLFETLSTPTEPGSTAPPFTWSATLLPAFTALFLSATASTSPSSGRDSALPLRLYLSWTSSGLSFPIGLWPALWRSVGRRGSLAELRRLVNDWEDTGRGAVSARIMCFVLEGASERRVVAPLRMLAWFRSRYVARPGASPSPLLVEAQPYLVVPLEGGYESVLEALAASHTDRRRAMSAVWRWMRLDGHAHPSTRAWNALIRAHILRPASQFSIADLDKAGVAYNALVAGARRAAPSSSSSASRSKAAATAARPDGDTFALLVRGFARVAAGAAVDARRSTVKRRIALEAGRRTLDAAVERGLHVSGVETALLVRLLARARRFEEAKTAQERWWSSVVALENQRGTKEVWADKGIARGMREMRWARTESELLEARWGARQAAQGRRKEGQPREEVEEDESAEPVPDAELEPVLRPSDPRT